MTDTIKHARDGVLGETVDRADLRPGDTVVVVGGGPVGQLTSLVAQACGAGAVVVIELTCFTRGAAAQLVDGRRGRVPGAFGGDHGRVRHRDARRPVGPEQVHDPPAVDALAADYEGRATIGKLKTKQDAARAVIQVGIIIGGADGNFDEDEKRAVREACHAVNIPTGAFDL